MELAVKSDFSPPPRDRAEDINSTIYHSAMFPCQKISNTQIIISINPMKFRKRADLEYGKISLGVLV